MSNNTGNLDSHSTVSFDLPDPGFQDEEPSARFEDALRQVLSVPKSVVDARVREENAERKRP